MSSSADSEAPTLAQMQAYADRHRRANDAIARERAERARDPERVGRDFLRAVGLTRRLIREGVATRESDWESHLAWSRLQDAMMERATDPD